MVTMRAAVLLRCCRGNKQTDSSGGIS
ncbi:MAG: hypothetical protein RIR00_423, partial [Pseudomonadota bacterium]